MEDLVNCFGKHFAGRRALVTGHTGFKGSWLCEWLLALGAEVHGLALDPLPDQLLFGQLGLAERLASDVRLDILDRPGLSRAIAQVRPEFLFHLAAQPLVRRSYREPVETFAVNIMGTVHVLEALREARMECVAIMVTTDKCYENREWLHAYREEDPMGGHDPYSASKGCAELAISSYRRSFFYTGHLVAVASARAGNVIGGGDWAEDRIVPDAMRALCAGRPIQIRNPQATRPWQHVLEPLGGYLTLAGAVSQARRAGDHRRLMELTGAFNFGPPVSSNQSVGVLAAEVLKHWPGEIADAEDPHATHEAGKLNLATDKAFHLLGWQSVWSFARTVQETVQWYARAKSESPQALTREQITAYAASAPFMNRLP